MFQKVALMCKIFAQKYNRTVILVRPHTLCSILTPTSRNFTSPIHLAVLVIEHHFIKGFFGQKKWSHRREGNNKRASSVLVN